MDGRQQVLTWLGTDRTDIGLHGRVLGGQLLTEKTKRAKKIVN